MTALARLIAAVEGLDGPMGAILGKQWHDAIDDCFPLHIGDLVRQAIRGDLNAAVAFHVAMLPGFDYAITQRSAGVRKHGLLTPIAWEYKDVPAIALVLADLKALQSKEGQPA
jgi:hypothetical protein